MWPLPFPDPSSSSPPYALSSHCHSSGLLGHSHLGLLPLLFPLAEMLFPQNLQWWFFLIHCSGVRRHEAATCHICLVFLFLIAKDRSWLIGPLRLENTCVLTFMRAVEVEVTHETSRQKHLLSSVKLYNVFFFSRQDWKSVLTWRSHAEPSHSRQVARFSQTHRRHCLNEK